MSGLYNYEKLNYFWIIKNKLRIQIKNGYEIILYENKDESECWYAIISKISNIYCFKKYLEDK